MSLVSMSNCTTQVEERSVHLGQEQDVSARKPFRPQLQRRVKMRMPPDILHLCKPTIGNSLPPASHCSTRPDDLPHRKIGEGGASQARPLGCGEMPDLDMRATACQTHI